MAEVSKFKKAAPYVITALSILVVLVLWAVFTKQVEIGSDGKPVAGGKRMATRFGLAKQKA